jgi:hypothetical protein
MLLASGESTLKLSNVCHEMLNGLVLLIALFVKGGFESLYSRSLSIFPLARMLEHLGLVIGIF